MDLTKLTNLTSVGPDAFSNIIGLETVKLSPDQAKTINPGVFSRSQTEGSDDQSFAISLQGGSQDSITFDPQAFGTSNAITLTPASNLNKFTGVTTMDLSAAPISTLEGGASSQSLTELEFSNFTLSPAPSTKKNAKNSDAFSQLNESTWSQVANILNMFGRVEDSKADSTNLLPWSENFSGVELTADSVKSGWSTNSSPSGSGDQTINGSDQTLYKLVNGVVWKYSKSSGSITLSVENGQKPNLYRAGYTNNPYAYQVGFATDGSDNNIKTDATVNVTLKLVKNG